LIEHTRATAAPHRNTKHGIRCMWTNVKWVTCAWTTDSKVNANDAGGWRWNLTWTSSRLHDKFHPDRRADTFLKNSVVQCYKGA